MNSSRLRRTVLAGLAALTLVGAGLVASSASAEEELTTVSVAPSGAPRGVAVSPDGTLIVVADEGSDSVSVIDAVTNTLIHTINGLADQPQAVAISPDGTLAYVTSAGAAAVNAIDLVNFTLIAPAIPVGTFPADVVFSKDGSKAYVSNLSSSSISVITVATSAVTNVPVGGGPQGLVLSPDGATLWMVQPGGGIQSLNTADNTVGPVFILTDPNVPNLQPRHLDISPDGTTLAIGGDTMTSVYLWDIASHTVADAANLGQFPYYPVYSPDGSRLYVGMGAGDVKVIDPASSFSVVDTIPRPGRIYGLDVAPAGDFIYAGNYDNNTVSVMGDPVRRLAGSSRYATAIKISQAGFPAGADVVFVATGLDYPDALAAGPAAAEMGGPVILTDPVALPAEVKAEIERLDPSHIYIVGGTGRVSAAIQTQLGTIATTDRIAGASRFETSRLIADLAFGTVTDAYVATGLNFPDALAAGAAGAVFGSPVLLVDGAASTVDQATLDLLTSLGSPDVTVVGGTNWVSAGIESQLNATRIAGASRYETALLINEAAYTGHTATRAIIATGVIFPDALSASAWAGAIDAPLYLSPGTCVDPGVIAHLTALGVLQVTLVGGVDRLDQAVFQLTPCA